MFKDLKEVINEAHSACGKGRPGSSDPEAVLGLPSSEEQSGMGEEKRVLWLERKQEMNNLGLCRPI